MRCNTCGSTLITEQALQHIYVGGVDTEDLPERSNTPPIPDKCPQCDYSKTI